MSSTEAGRSRSVSPPRSRGGRERRACEKLNAGAEARTDAHLQSDRRRRVMSTVPVI